MQYVGQNVLDMSLNTVDRVVGLLFARDTHCVNT
jgi:hypothetical protein